MYTHTHSTTISKSNTDNKRISPKGHQIKAKLLSYQSLPLLFTSKASPEEAKADKSFLNDKAKKMLIFNKLYGIKEDYLFRLKRIRQEKTLSVQQHQAELLNLSSNLSQANRLRLIKDFRMLNLELSHIRRLPSIQVTKFDKSKPLPSVRLDCKSNEKRTIVFKSFEKNRRNGVTKAGSKQEEVKEVFDYKAMRSFKKTKANPSLLKMYEVLPSNLVEILLSRMR